MNKSLGQNFLIDENIAKKEIEYANLTDEDIVLEIGPGKGILTNLIAKKAKKVIAIEIDSGLYKNLKAKIPKNVQLINEDILDIDLNKIKFNKIISNLPYQISSKLTFKILEKSFDLAVLIYQKEFAQRLVAKKNTKDYSRITVNFNYKAKCELLRNVSKNCFYPKPKVDSSIVRIKPRINPPFLVLNEKFFNNFVKNMFNHRRKKIKTILKNKYFIEESISPQINKRIENLSPKEIGDLSNEVYKIKNL